jgi:hypothetical protein
MWERGWGALSAKDWGKRILPGNVNKQVGWAGEAPAGAGKLVKVAVGEKLHRRGGEDPLPMRTVNKHAGLRKQVQCHHPSVLGKGKACSRGSHTGEF